MKRAIHNTFASVLGVRVVTLQENSWAAIANILKGLTVNEVRYIRSKGAWNASSSGFGTSYPLLLAYRKDGNNATITCVNSGFIEVREYNYSPDTWEDFYYHPNSSTKPT